MAGDCIAGSTLSRHASNRSIESGMYSHKEEAVGRLEHEPDSARTRIRANMVLWHCSQI
jgi:hypothetical protein